MSIVVTGAAGFIGRAMVRRLNLLGEQPILVDYPDVLLRPHATSGLRFRRCYSPDDFLGRLRKKEVEVQRVYHLGALSSTLNEDSKGIWEKNYAYTMDLVEALARYDLWTPHFVFVSSASVYGNSPRDRKVGHPENMYAASKSMAEQALMDCEGVTIVRPFNVYGPGEWSKPETSRSFLYRAAAAVANGQTFLYHSPQSCRDFIHVDDVTFALSSMLREDRGPFDLGTGENPSIADVVENASSLFLVEGTMENVHPSYQRNTRANWDPSCPFDPMKFLGWREGFAQLVEQIKEGSRL